MRCEALSKVPPSAVKKMAELLRSGAAMLAETCPQCGSPLFRLRSGEVICPVHGRVIVARTEEEVVQAEASTVLEALERAVVKKLAEASKDLDSVDLGRVVVLLEILERIRRIRGIQQLERRGEAERGSRS